MRSSVFFAALLLAALLIAPAMATDKLPEPKEIISNLDAAFSKINDYTCVARAHYRKGYAREDKVYKIYFKKPSLVRIEILEGDGGSVAVLTNDGKVKAHSGGFLSWLVLNLDIESPLVKTIRGHTMDQSHFGYIIDRMKETLKLEKPKTAGRALVDGTETLVMATDYMFPSDNVTKDMAFVDPKKWLVKKLLSYEGSTEVVNVTYSDIEENVGLSDKLFEL